MSVMSSPSNPPIWEAGATINVLVVEDHALVRQGILALLSSTAGLRVVGDVGSGLTAVAMVGQLRPRIVLMDLAMPGVDGIECTRQIVGAYPGTGVIALSAFDDRRHVVDAFRAGVRGYVVKDSVVDQLIEAIRKVAAGQRYMSPAMASLVLSDLSRASDQRADQLTSREREVLALLADGRAMKEAAARLRISTKTVETHRRAIMEKLQLFSVAELTKHAIREGYSSLNGQST